MKVLNRLTMKHLMMNKKRTIVTIIGLILSTSLMVGIGLLFSTMLEGLKQEEMERNGSHHAVFYNLTESEKDVITNNINIKDSYYYGTIGFAKISSDNRYKPYIYIASSNDELFKTEKIIEGRYPVNNEEIIIPSHLETFGVNYKIGDKITLQLGYRQNGEEKIYDNNISLMERYEKEEFIIDETLEPVQTKTYTVVGIMERSNKEHYSSPGFLAYTTKENKENIKGYQIFVNYKNVKKTFELTEEIASNLNNLATTETNDSLLYYYGVSRYSNINSSITSVLTIMLSLVSIGCIIVIYNSFAISTMERKKSFGLYASLGATPKQIKYTVFFEAFFVGTIGIILGILGAFLGIYILIQVLAALLGSSLGLQLKFAVEPLYIIIPIIFMIVVVFLSAYLPAKRASKVSPVELIRENDSIKIPRRKVRTPEWIGKVFGVEGIIALKNMKRNKGKYRITILSLFISIVLFISFSTYLKVGVNITSANDIPSYDIMISSSDKEKLKELNLDGIEESYITSYLYYNYKPFPFDYYQKDYRDSLHLKEHEEDLQMIAIYILEDDDFIKLTQQNNPLLYNSISFTTYTNSNRTAYQVPMLTQEVNTIEICTEDSCKEIPMTLSDDCKELVEKIPTVSNRSIPMLFLSSSLAEKYQLSEEQSYYRSIFSKNYEQIYQTLENEYKNSKDIDYYSPKLELKETHNTILAIKILLYGFITLVTLTGITSVFNTIYTSIHLRRKEFAMLRSIGLSPKGFNKMIFFESLFFGIKSLFYSLPVSAVLIYIINRSISDSFYFGKLFIPWGSILIAIIGVFIIVLLTMLYSVKKIKKENILNSLKEENI